eukprot:GEMP01056127.1.p1 GENE.GEMP01056127.1~~GEMP01056127.1.p1  ORF type:complete len:343 (+),score=54.80 GEMP01056127.1:74-1102(+)
MDDGDESPLCVDVRRVSEREELGAPYKYDLPEPQQAVAEGEAVQHIMPKIPRHRARRRGESESRKQGDALLFAPRYQQGIQLQFMGATTSEFGFFDFPALAAIIAVFLLYIGIVPLLIKLIAIYLLGNTSRTYKRAQQEVLQVQESCQREFPAKMLTATTVFYMISTIEQMGKKGISISNRGLEGNVGFDVLSHLLGHCLKEEKELDEGETKNIIQSIYEQLGGDDGHVSLSEFIRAFTHSEVFDMEALINTYDVQRKRNCMEYIFADATDRAVAKERKEREKAGEDMSGVKEDEENPELGTGVTEDPDAAGGGKPKGKGKGAKKQRSGSPRAQGPTPENTQ